MVHHLVHSYLPRHTDCANDALRDGVQAWWDHGGHRPLHELDQHHESQVLSVFLGKQRRGQSKERRGDGGRTQPHDFLIAVIHEVTCRSLGEELAHSKDEKHDARLLLCVVLRQDEEGRLHVNHGQTVPYLAEEQGDVPQYALGARRSRETRHCFFLLCLLCSFSQMKESQVKSRLTGYSLPVAKTASDRLL